MWDTTSGSIVGILGIIEIHYTSLQSSSVVQPDLLRFI